MARVKLGCKDNTHYAVRLLAAVLFALLALSAAAMAGGKGNSAGGGTAGGGGGGGSSAGGSSPASGPAAPQATPLLAGYKSFYVIADGAEPNFGTFASERTVEYLGLAFFKQADEEPVYFVAVPGWTQDTLTTACANDDNVVGGLIIKYVSFYTEAYWIAYNAETQHVTPSLIFISCYNNKPIQVAPTINIFTQKSGPQISVPLGPLTALATLFTFKGSSSSTTAYQVDYGSLVFITAAGSLSGNVGVYNPGHEALGVANRVGLQATVVTQSLCGLQPKDPPIGVGKSQTHLVADLAQMATILDQNSYFTQKTYVNFYTVPARDTSNVTPEMNPGLDLIFGLEYNDQKYWKKDIGLPKEVSSSPSTSTTVSTSTTSSSTTFLERLSYHVKGASNTFSNTTSRSTTTSGPTATPTPSPTPVPTPTGTPKPAGPLTSMCSQLGGPVPSDTQRTPTPLPTLAPAP